MPQYGLDPNFDYESILGEYSPKKTKALTEVANILSRPVFKTGKKRYAVRVYRNTGTVNLATYQIDVRADNLSSLRLKLIKNIPWDLQRKNGLTTSVKIYKTYAIDKYNVAGWLSVSYSKQSYVWDPDNDGPNRIVDPRTGMLKGKYDSDKDFNMAKAREYAKKTVKKKVVKRK